MKRLIAVRLLLAAPLLLVVSLLSFVLQSFIPGNAAAALIGPNASAAQIAKLAELMHLNRPLYEQYWSWLTGVFHGSLGYSLENGESVSHALNQRLWVTVALVCGSTVLATLLGALLGLLSSRGGRVTARATDVVSVAGLAIPGFWLGLLLIEVFSVRLGWLPATGYVAISASLAGWARSLVLPVVALGFAGMTSVAKVTRQAMLEIGGRDFVRNLRANGIPERSVLFKHCLRSAALSVVTMSGFLFVNALGASVIIENVFGLPGLGSLAVTATAAHDIPLIQGVAIYFTLMVIAMNLFVDIAYGWINPMARRR